MFQYVDIVCYSLGRQDFIMFFLMKFILLTEAAINW